MPGEVVTVPPLVVLVNVLTTLTIFVLVLRTILANIYVFVGRERLGRAFGAVVDFIVDGTEPLLVPVRRIIPPTGLSFDFSPLVAIIIIDIIGRLITFALLRVL